MSAKISGLVWDLDLPREEKYVLLCLSDHADHDGNNVFPSVGLVAWKTGYSERRIQQLMRILEHRGLLPRVDEQFGRGKTVRYRINLDSGVFRERPKKGAKISPFSPQSRLQRGEISQADRVQRAALKGELATAPESLKQTSFNQLPLPPSYTRGLSRKSGKKFVST
jgi:hypothetical protein